VRQRLVQGSAGLLGRNPDRTRHRPSLHVCCHVSGTHRNASGETTHGLTLVSRKPSERYDRSSQEISGCYILWPKGMLAHALFGGRAATRLRHTEVSTVRRDRHGKTTLAGWRQQRNPPIHLSSVIAPKARRASKEIHLFDLSAIL